MSVRDYRGTAAWTESVELFASLERQAVDELIYAKGDQVIALQSEIQLLRKLCEAFGTEAKRG